MNIFSTLAEKAREANLDFLIIGGHAINSHGYLRTTLDVDVLITESQLPAWKELLAELGYVWGHESPAFVQFAQPQGSDEFPIDLMVVDQSTFAKLIAQAVRKSFGDVELLVPRIKDLIALKLHALRSADRAAQGKDLPDVIALIRLGSLTLSDAELCAILDKHATDATRSEITRLLSGN